MEKNNEEYVLHHQLEEWKLLNDYINKIDLSYSQTFIVILGILSIITALSSRETNGMSQYMVLIVPPGMLSAFAYLSYQFRIVAIIRGRLSAIENDINELLDRKVHLWNSVLVDTHMANNNIINQWMMAPIMFLVAVLAITCMYLSWEVLSDSTFKMVILAIYWIVILAFAVIVTIPFLENEKIRRETSETRGILEKYEQLQLNNKKN